MIACAIFKSTKLGHSWTDLEDQTLYWSVLLSPTRFRHPLGNGSALKCFTGVLLQKKSDRERQLLPSWRNDNMRRLKIDFTQPFLDGSLRSDTPLNRTALLHKIQASVRQWKRLKVLYEDTFEKNV